MIRPVPAGRCWTAPGPADPALVGTQTGRPSRANSYLAARAANSSGKEKRMTAHPIKLLAKDFLQQRAAREDAAMKKAATP